MSDTKTQVALPFTTYDFFGYIYPSVALVVGLRAVDYLTNIALNGKASVPFRYLLQASIDNIRGMNNLPLQTAAILVAVFAAYVLGHMIAAGASLFGERIFLRNVYGYPYKMLLFKRTSDIDEPRSAFYVAMYTLPTLGILFLPLKFFTASWLLWFVPRFFLLAAATLLIWKILLAFIPRRERPVRDVFRTVLYWTFELPRILHRFACILLALPYRFVAKSLAKLMHTDQPFPEKFSDAVKQKYHDATGLDAEADDTNVYWLSYCLVVKNALYRRLLDNWLVQYSFARNICASLYVVSFYAVASAYLNETGLRQLQGLWYWVMLSLPFGIHLLSIVMLMRYYYLYAGYYTKFLFRAFHSLDSPVPKKPSKERAH